MHGLNYLGPDNCTAENFASLWQYDGAGNLLSSLTGLTKFARKWKPASEELGGSGTEQEPSSI